MLPEERRASLLEAVATQGYIQVSEMAARFDVSAPTIRRDLDQLHEEGKLIRTRGGAVTGTRSTTLVLPYETKRHKQIEQKRRIAQEAASLVESGDQILLDAGSTTFELAQELVQARRLTVVTNDLRIATQLAANPNIELIATGGIARPTVYSLVGPETIDFLDNIHVKTVFLAVDAIHPDGGIYNQVPEENGVKKAMVRAADQVVLLADSTKFSRRAFAHVCDLDAVDVLITDNGIAAEVLERIEPLTTEIRVV